MIKIEAVTLEAAYKEAASKLECSVTELRIEIIQAPSKGILGLFKKPAIIVAVKETNSKKPSESNQVQELEKREALQERNAEISEAKDEEQKVAQDANTPKKETSDLKEKKTSSSKKAKKESRSQQELNDTIMPTSFVSMQDEEDDDEDDVSSYLADYDDEEDANEIQSISEIAKSVQVEINELFDLTCFSIDSIDVSVYDENTLLVEFKGEDAALLIGKEGYRYKALSYMLFNWINTKYQVQLRLEIAEFLKNQEESISKYLVGVCENIERDGRAQTKILDGVLIQIALNELRDRYPDKYIVIRSTRDGLKYIIINDYHSN
jgi:spoIIIJ-associated protein